MRSPDPPEVGLNVPVKTPGTTTNVRPKLVPPAGLPTPVAVTRTCPGARPETLPLASTDATVALLDAQVGAGKPVISLPAASKNLNWNCTVVPESTVSGPMTSMRAGKVATCMVSTNPAAAAATQVVP